jgi:hypothetical protein
MQTQFPRLAKIFGPVLLLVACLALASCIIVAPRRHHRWEAPPAASQSVRP